MVSAFRPLLCSLLFAVGVEVCAAVSPNVPPASPAPAAVAPPVTALERAVALAALVDDDEFQSRLKLELVEFLLRQPALDPAAALAESIPGYRRGVALAKVGAACGREKEEAVRAQAEGFIAKATAVSDFPHPWQRDAIRAEVALAWTAAGRDPAAAKVIEGLTESTAKYRTQGGRAVALEARGAAWDDAVFDVPAEVTKLTPELLLLARAAIEIAQQRQARGTADVAPLCEKAEALVRACKATAGEEYLDLGMLWRQMGKLERSAELLGIAVRQLPPGVDMQGWQPGTFARMVRLYREAGDEIRVDALLETARKGIRAMHAFHQPPALCQVAEAELAAGRPQRAEETWAEAVGLALGNPNPGSRSLGAAQVCFSLARVGRPLPDRIVAILAPLAPASPSDSARTAQ